MNGGLKLSAFDGGEMSRVRLVLMIIGTAAIGQISASINANEILQDSPDLFEEVMVIREGKPRDEFARLGDIEKQALFEAKDTLTQFFRRINPGSQESALEILSTKLRAQYETTRSFYRDHFKSEALVSYRITHFALAPDKQRVTFWITLRETTEGVEFGKQRIVTLFTAPDGWRIAGIE